MAANADDGSNNIPFGMPANGGDMAEERDETIEDIVQTVHRLFEAFSNSDSSGFSSLVDNDARFVRTGYTEDGSPDVTSYPKEYFVATLTKTEKGHLVERIFQPFVQHRDTMAHVWCRYELSVGGEPKYAGVKSIQLRLSSQGWRIVNVCDTVDC